MRNHGDGATPLWITEIAWGSAPPDQLRDQQGPRRTGAAARRSAFELILSHRKAWNVQRVFWYHWRDPRQLPGELQLLRERGAGQRQPRPEAGLLRVHEVLGRTIPPRRASLGPQPGRRTSATRRPRSNSAQTRSAPPSSAVSTPSRLVLLRLAIHPSRPARERPTRLLRQGGRRSRQRERAGLAVVHRRHRRPAGSGSPRARRRASPPPTPGLGSSSSPASPTSPSVAGSTRARSSLARLPAGLGPLADGRHIFAIVAIDAAGNIGHLATRALDAGGRPCRIGGEAPLVG